MSNRNFFALLVLIGLVIFGGVGATYVAAQQVPEDQLSCEWSRDILFISGERVSIKRCTALGFERIKVMVRDDEARLVGRCDDHIYYFNNEDDFPPAPRCEWIEETPMGRR